MVNDRLVQWIDVTRGLLAEPLTELPHPTLLTELVDTFGAKAGSWLRRHRDGHIDYDLCTPQFDLTPEAVLWMGARLDEHPLVRWFAATGDLTAQTISRVPSALHDPRYAAWTDIVGPLEVEQQMAIPLTLFGQVHRAFVIVTHDEDFSDQDLHLARQLQGLLIGLERQAQTLARWMPTQYMDEGRADEVGLTGRELAVLSLVARSLTAQTIGRRLLISPRTVEKHLEHVYAKLGTSDRVAAVLRAHALGLLHPGTCGSRALSDSDGRESV